MSKHEPFNTRENLKKAILLFMVNGYNQDHALEDEVFKVVAEVAEDLLKQRHSRLKKPTVSLCHSDSSLKC